MPSYCSLLSYTRFKDDIAKKQNIFLRYDNSFFMGLYLTIARYNFLINLIVVQEWSCAKNLVYKMQWQDVIKLGSIEQSYGHVYK